MLTLLFWCVSYISLNFVFGSLGQVAYVGPVFDFVSRLLNVTIALWYWSIVGQVVVYWVLARTAVVGFDWVGLPGKIKAVSESSVFALFLLGFFTSLSSVAGLADSMLRTARQWRPLA